MKNFGIWLIRIALVLFVLGLFFGHLASESYRITQPKSGVMGFLSLRPLHVSSAYLGIITAGLGFLTLIIVKMIAHVNLNIQSSKTNTSKSLKN